MLLQEIETENKNFAVICAPNQKHNYFSNNQIHLWKSYQTLSAENCNITVQHFGINTEKKLFLMLTRKLEFTSHSLQIILYNCEISMVTNNQ
ncbi:hypothetical protein T11_3930 [Trichinella zimbabwensis]|uniref:Uncharacterized protein n=1 Tax=Trichinella zimbabwensis TaxID=268475 RepID=A0A0V1GXS3_9BILA|nr:hypothetical protein T11_3930 [Trichinella zimbabwensis]